MADVQHKDITDPFIHETKGIVAATNGQVHAKVGGVGAFVTPSTLTNQRQVVVLTGSTATAQNPVAVDTPINVTFGGVQAGVDASIDASGLITINTAGFYRFKFNLSFGRTSGAGEAILLARLLVNGTATGFVQGCRLPDENTSSPTQFDIEFACTPGQTIRVELVRDSAGVNNGGLIPIVSVLASWADVPSAWVRVTKLIGSAA